MTTERHRDALSILREIERNDHCVILSLDSIEAVELGMSRHALRVLSQLRSEMEGQTWSAREKHSALELIDAAIFGEQQ